MTLNQLSKINLNVQIDFMIYEARLYDLLQGEATKEYVDAVLNFTSMYFLREEIKAHLDKYERARSALTNYLAGKPFFEPVVDDDKEISIWEYCLWKLATGGDRFQLAEVSPEFKHYISIQYNRETALNKAFNKFFPGIEKVIVKGDQATPISSDEAAIYELQTSLSALETSFSADSYLERMKKAKLLCEEKADPAEILKLFV